MWTFVNKGPQGVSRRSLTSISDRKICSERQRQHEHGQARARTRPAGAAEHKQKSQKECVSTRLTLMNRDFNDMLQKQIEKSTAFLRSLQKSPKDLIDNQQQWSRLLPQLTPEILNGKVAYQIHDLARTALDWDDVPPNISNRKGPQMPGNMWTMPLIVNTAIQAWGKLGNSTRAEELVKRMIQRDHAEFAPNYATYVSLIDAFGRSGDAEKAIHWLGRIPNNMSRPSTLSATRIHNGVLNAFARNGQAEEAVAYLKKMKDQLQIEPDSYSYSAIMQAWKNSDLPDARFRVEALLDAVKENYQAQRQEMQAPNKTVTGVAMSMAVSPESCENMLNNLVQMYLDSNRNKLFEPNARHFMTVMNMYAKTGQPNRTEEVFQKMEELYRDGIASCRPTYRAYMTLVDAYCKQGTLKSCHYARKLLDRLEPLFGKDLNNWGYNMVMDAFIKTTKDSMYAEELFHRMLEMSEMYPGLTPDKVTYTCLMKAWIQEGKPGYFDRVENLLTRMERSQQKSATPDQVTFGVVLDGLAQSGLRDTDNRANVVLQRMLDQGVEPNRVIFNSLLSIRVKQRGPVGAEELLRLMDTMDIGHQCRPSAENFNTIILSWARSGRSDECFEASMRLFEDQVNRFIGGEYLCKPQETTLTAILSALASSSNSNKAERTRVLLNTFEQQFSVVPNRIILSSVINVCSKEIGEEAARQEALALAVSTFQLIRHSHASNDSDAAIYGALLDACYNLPSSHEGKENAMSDAFKTICEDGQMQPSVLYIFRRAFPNSPLLKGIENNSMMPSSWTRNVVTD